MAEKRTVYLTPETLAMVREGESLSGRINDIFERYAALHQHLPGIILDIDHSAEPMGHTWADIEACRKAIKDQ